MKLLDRLTKKRDEHLHQARRFQDLIDVLTGDPDLARATHATAAAIMHKAAHANGNGAAHGPKRKRAPLSPAARKKIGARTKKLWKEKRSVMLAAVRKGNARKLRADDVAPTVTIADVAVAQDDR